MAATGVAAAFRDSLRGYRPAWLGRDAIAGVLITATAIPLGIGFAQAAGLPAVVGLYTSVAPLIVYGLLGSSRHVKIGLDASAAAMIGAVIVPLASHAGQVDTGLLVALSALVSVLTGVILLVAGILRAGFLADLLSLPLLVGYQAGIALSVILGQLPKMAGTTAAGSNDLARFAHFLAGLGEAHAPTVLLSLAALGALLVLQARWPRLPAALVVLVAAGAASAMFGWSAHGIAVIGRLPTGLPTTTLPSLAQASGQWGTLLGVAASLALVSAADVVIASRTFASRGHYRVSANADIAGLGVAEIASGLTGGVPASASYVRTAICEHVGSRSQLSAVFGGLFMAAVVIWFTGLLAAVPLAVLAAICVATCLRLIDLAALRRLWRLRRSDAAIALATALLVLASDPLVAVAAAVAFSVISFLARAARPHFARLGRRRGIEGWFPIDQYADAEVREPDTVVVDWDGPLMFANARTFCERVAQLCGPGVRHVIVDCSAIFDVDPSALAALEELVTELAGRGVDLALAAPAPDAMAQLRRAGLPALLGEGPRVFLDIDTALVAMGKRPAPPGQLVDRDGDGVYEYVKAPGDGSDRPVA